MAQDDAQATYAPRLQKADAEIDWSRPASEIDQRIRAFNPWPVAETRFDGQRLRCWRSQVAEPNLQPACSPGTILAATADGLDVQTGDGVLRITELQLPGRQKISAADFANAVPAMGRVLGR